MEILSWIVFGVFVLIAGNTTLHLWRAWILDMRISNWREKIILSILTFAGTGVTLGSSALMFYAIRQGF